MTRNEHGQLVALSLDDIADHIADYAAIARNRRHIAKRNKGQLALDDAQAKAYEHAARIIRETVLSLPELQELPDGWQP